MIIEGEGGKWDFRGWWDDKGRVAFMSCFCLFVWG